MWQAAALGIIALVHQIETYFLPVMGLKSWIEIDSHEGKNVEVGSSKAIFKLKKPADHYAGFIRIALYYRSKGQYFAAILINHFYDIRGALLTFCYLGFCMKKNSSSDDLESTTLGWKFIAIVAVITSIFFTFLYLAMSSEPDYMPNRKPKVATQQDVPVNAPQPVEKTSSE